METIRAFGAPGVQTDPTNGDTILTVYPHALVPSVDDHSHRAAIVIRIPVTDVANFMTQVVNCGGLALGDAVRALQYGDCDYCENTRLVDAPAPGGRTQRVRCHECNAAGPRTDIPMVRKPGFHPHEVEGIEF